MFATPIHDGPSIGSGLTQGAPRRSSGSWARPSDAEFSQGRQIARCAPCKGSVLIGAPRLPGHASSVAHLAFYAYFMHARSGRARGSPLSSDAGWRIAGRARLCAPRVRGGSKPNPAPRNLGLDLILDNPTTNAPPPIHPVPPTLLHPDPSLLGVRNTEHRRMHSRPVSHAHRSSAHGWYPSSHNLHEQNASLQGADTAIRHAPRNNLRCAASLHRTSSNS